MPGDKEQINFSIIITRTRALKSVISLNKRHILIVPTPKQIQGKKNEDLKFWLEILGVR